MLLKRYASALCINYSFVLFQAASGGFTIGCFVGCSYFLIISTKRLNTGMILQASIARLDITSCTNGNNLFIYLMKLTKLTKANSIIAIWGSKLLQYFPTKDILHCFAVTPVFVSLTGVRGNHLCWRRKLANNCLPGRSVWTSAGLGLQNSHTESQQSNKI